jgi:hypothetical protein
MKTTSYSAGVDIWDHFDMLPVVEKCKITLRASQESGGILRLDGKWINWEQYLSGENVGIMVTAHSGTDRGCVYTASCVRQTDGRG